MRDAPARLKHCLEEFVLLTAFVTHSDCLRHEMGPGHPECPERLVAIQDRLHSQGLLDRMACHDAPLASAAQLAGAHAPAYVGEIFNASPKDGYLQLDPDTLMNRYTLQAALRAAGAAIHATDLVLTGQASNAFCSVRPPGHHAERDRAMGFCLFNSVAVAIRHALEVHGLERVALIDFDVHHGNGSEDVFCQDSRVLMCSIFQRGLFPLSGDKAPEPRMVNVGLSPRSEGDALRDVVRTQWLPALEAFRPQAVFVSAGFDAHANDPLGNLSFQVEDYRWVTGEIAKFAQATCSGRVISCLEGGYDLDALARSVCAHIEVLVAYARLPAGANPR
jgi:acetoin utilization deacetylase AcuC-like enzyme